VRWWLGIIAGISVPACGSDEPTETDPSDFEVCAEVSETADRVPVNLLLTIDRSGSMLDGEPVPKWEVMTSALRSFVDSEDAQQLQVGLRLWPTDDGCDTAECDALVCSMPQVSAAPLADGDHRDAILEQVDLLFPDEDGETPLSAALEGARTWAADVRRVAPDEQVAIALLTDGRPNGCDESIDDIAQIASDTLTDGSPTYVLGIEGSREADVDRIAAAGGTAEAFFVGTKNGEEELLVALLEIQGSVLSCSYDFPEGKDLDPGRIRIDLVIDGEVTRLARVDDAAACTGEAFFLTNDGARITLCEDTCAAARETLESSIDIAIACTCEVDEDCPGDEECEEGICTPPDGEGDSGFDGSRRVQGGATTCASAPGLAPWWLALGLLAFVRRRGDA